MTVIDMRQVDGTAVVTPASLPIPSTVTSADDTVGSGVGFLPSDGRASVLTLDGRASVMTKDCNGPTEGVAAKFVCPWTSRMPAVLCRRHRSAWDLCGLVLILLLCLLLILVLCFLHPCLFHNSCAGPGRQAAGEEEGKGGERLCLTADCVQTAASLLAAMDHSVDPCQDFFQYACGTWNRKHVIPEDRSSVSTFEVLADQLQIILKELLEAPHTSSDMTIASQAKNLYQSCINMENIEEEGEAPLQQVLSDLGDWPVTLNQSSWREPPSLEVIIAKVRKIINNGILIDIWVGPDDRNSNEYILQVDQPHLGLPSRDYYLQERSRKDLEAYHAYMTQVAVLMGAKRATAASDLWKVIEFEIRIANISIDEADRHDTGQWYKKMSISELTEQVPQVNWTRYFHTIMEERFTEDIKLVSYAMPYLERLGEMLEREDRVIVYNYLMWRVVMELMPYLPLRFQSARAEFKRVLLGVLAERNRWNMCVEWTNKKMGMAVGSLFVRNHFNHESKVVALEMIHGIREAFNELLSENHWMDEETREVARDKANAMNERIGYPDYILNDTALTEEYNNITLTGHSFLHNILAILSMEAEKNLVKLGQTVDKERWSTAPAVVNAFYSPNKNDIVFPAGILQPLFYSRFFPKSLNYGGIGVVIGHEITHGFDDKGRQFDKNGNLQQWWNNATISRFRHQAQCIVDQYSGYRLDNIDLPINGKMTQGENIADNGGLKQAYRAYKKWVEKHGQEPNLPGLNLTHDQLFFLNYAQIWCGSMRPEDAQTKILSSVHAPGPVRVLGPLSNSRDFALAYNCPLGSRMNPEKKCSVW